MQFCDEVSSPIGTSPSACAFRETWCAQDSRNWPNCSQHLDLVCKRFTWTNPNCQKERHSGFGNKTSARLLFDTTNTFQPGMVLRSTPSRRGTPNSGHLICWDCMSQHDHPWITCLPHRCHFACVVLVPQWMVLRFRPDHNDLHMRSSVLQTLRIVHPQD